MSMYPDDKEIEVHGEVIKFPGLDENGKFTNGDFNNHEKKASFIPAETINLILDNLNEIIKHSGLEPNNFEVNQLLHAIEKNHNELPIGSQYLVHYTGANSEIVDPKTPLPTYGVWEKISIGGFLRFKDANANENRQANGYQNDAIRNITGTISGFVTNPHATVRITPLFTLIAGDEGMYGRDGSTWRGFTFDTSRVVSTSQIENRVANEGTWEFIKRIA